ncbi:DNA-binding transcriptional LysR family regulator [Luteibacter sp. Sphag1AF]|uniref:LysR family transcriptional regulator n=1 Tax=Luteibacter sp. Sphag1AF TaxID=2587031 RepID=UPI001615F9CB|nr:LysR family transcriptional regulator [Luteibacter sp. Sphag1AF]MBB3226007.1 DNA-binding transcriptional LysR family regulator [Luteibacter sp. Sphag1AF]
MKATLEELLAFVTVVDSGSMTAAADQLQQTVSAVSRALGRLEEKLETTLMRRTTRRLELTEEGVFFLERARAVLHAMDEAEQEMSARRQMPAGRLRIDAAAPFMLHVIVPIVAGFREAFPGIELELATSDHVIDLLEHRTDVAIRVGPLRDSTLHARPLGASRLRILASPGYLAAQGTPQVPDDLRSHTLLGFTQPDSLNRWPIRQEHADEWHVRPSIAASSGETIRQLAIAGQGIACLSEWMSREDVTRGILVPVLPEHTVDVRQPVHAVYYRNTQLASRITHFLDYVSERLRGKL